VSTLLQRLLPFLHNPNSVVRLSSLKTLAASVRTVESNDGKHMVYIWYQTV
jgi:hypothetical protein